MNTIRNAQILTFLIMCTLSYDYMYTYVCMSITYVFSINAVLYSFHYINFTIIGVYYFDKGPILDKD